MRRLLNESIYLPKVGSRLLSDANAPVLIPSKQTMRRLLMIFRATLIVLFATTLALAQHDHSAMVNQQGDKVMGFSHDKTTHHFVLTADGGFIEGRANDLKDPASLDQIRGHFQHIARMFSEGNFNAPMLVHSQDVPGTATMARL